MRSARSGSVRDAMPPEMRAACVRGRGRVEVARVPLPEPGPGEGRVAGFSVTAEPMSVRRVIGFMPDDFGVYDGMKVWEFLDFFAVAYEIPRSYRKKIIGEVLDLPARPGL